MLNPQRLRHYRERRALSQRELARLADVGHITIARLEMGQHQARSTTLLKLAAALGVKPASLTRS